MTRVWFLARRSNLDAQRQIKHEIRTTDRKIQPRKSVDQDMPG